MANDAALRSALVWVAAVMVVVGVTTFSFKKMGVTYLVGVLGISGILVPDWGYFNRDFSRWTSPVTAEERAADLAQGSGLTRVKNYPMRVIGYTIVYGYGLYKWWKYVSS